MAKLTDFIIAMVLIGLFAGIFGLFIVDMGQHYELPSDYNDSANLEVYNQLAELNQTAYVIKTEAESVKAQTGVLDVIGDYFKNGYNALKLTATSFKTFFIITDAGIKDANLGAGAELFKTAIITIVLILIFVGVIIAALLKWQI